MGRIPTIQEDEKLGLSALKVVAGPESFGSYEAKALQSAASGVQDMASSLNQITAEARQKAATSEAASGVATFDYTARQIERQKDYGPGQAGFYKDTPGDYTAAVDQHLAKIQFSDPKARDAARTQLMARMPGYLASSAQFEAKQTTDYVTGKANEALDALKNKVRADPGGFDQALKDGAVVIDATPNIPESLRPGMVKEYEQGLARTRFDAMLQNAKTPEEVDAIAKELADPNGPWQKRMSPADFDRTMDGMKGVRAAIGTKNDATARAAMTSIEERHNKSVLIDPNEMAALEPTIMKSENPAVQWRWQEIKMQQEVIRAATSMPTNELRGRVAGARGGSVGGYPSVPPDLAGAANAAAAGTGGKVSSGYLAGLAVQEYGKYLTPPRAQGKPEFAPKPQGDNVDLRHVNPQVADAATVAGEIFGRPLTITSGYRSQEKQDSLRSQNPGAAAAGRIAGHSGHTDASALDISTVGMSAADKGKLVGALVQAGFTGFGEYDTHIHADMRQQVPSSYDSSKRWGGWTQMSPEVMGALDAAGYKAGADSTTIRRGDRARTSTSWNVDYGKGADGGGTSAVGVAQFVKETWLGVMATPAFADAVKGKTEQQILDMRKDPALSMKAAAALAVQNKDTMEKSLGRPVTDAELYMGHFLGAGGAVALIGASKSNPTALAKDILPEAAKNNKARFYDGDRPLTVQETLGGIATAFNGSPSRVAFSASQAQEGALNARDKAVKQDMVSEGARSKMWTVTDLRSEGDFAERGRTARAMADFYSVPYNEAKPFTESEVEAIAKKLQEGGADAKVALMSQVQSMGGEMARAGMKQLGEKDPVFEHAAGLAANGQQGVATDIMRGQDRATNNPDIAKSEAMKGFDDEFAKSFQGALLGVDPRSSQAIRDAAKNLYLQRWAAGNPDRMDRGQIADAVHAVMGAGKGQQAVDSVNGAKTVLPPGVSGAQFDKALDNMTSDDLVAMSKDGNPPRFQDGTAIDPHEIASEGRFEFIGGTSYRIRMADGKYAISDALPGGGFRPYVMNVEPQTVKQLLARPGQPQPSPYSNLGALP